MISFTLFLVFTAIVLSGIVFAVKVELKQYPSVTTTDCGIGDESQLFDDQCFLWYKSSDMSQSSIKNGRNAMDGEMPFTAWVGVHYDKVSKFHYCSGAVLNERWIITAAQCIRAKNHIAPTNITVVPGLRHMKDFESAKKYYTKQYFIHEKYGTTEFHINEKNDIAVVKLNEDIPLMKKGKSNLNSVCLPNSQLLNVGGKQHSKDSALFSGWGKLNETTKNEGSLQVGLIKEPYFDNNRIVSNFSFLQSKDVVIPCGSDYGGPLVQYEKGRAVLLGIFVQYQGIDVNPNLACADQSVRFFHFTSVAYNVDWIVKTVTEKSRAQG